MSMERRITAILVADMIGFSRLMELDEVGTITRQKSHRTGIIDPLIDLHGGRIFKTTGDGFLGEFPSVVEAVACAVSIQRAITTSEAEEPGPTRISYRIGINLGDVMHEAGDLHGDGVNVAARLEQMSDPGGLCISGTAFDQLRSTIDVGYEDLGDIQVKNIVRPIRAWRVLLDPEYAGKVIGIKSKRLNLSSVIAASVVFLGLAVGAYLWAVQPDFEPADPAKMAITLPEGPSIAVLPFDYLGPEKAANDWIADGLSENIISALARIPDALVIARNSTFTLKGKAIDVREVSETFGVRYVLEGSVQQSGDTLRITAQLVDGVAGQHIWTETFDRPKSDVFAVQDEITLAVARSINDHIITGADVGSYPETNNLDAWATRLRGYDQGRNFSPDGIKRAQALYEKAIELDPKYSRGYSALANTYAFQARFGYTSDRALAAKTAIEFADKALTFSPQNSFAHVAKSMSYMVLKQPDEALDAALKAVEVAPSDGFSVAMAGWAYKYSGKPNQALPYFTRSRRIFVITPWWVVVEEYGALIDAGEFEAAQAIGDDMIDRGPPFARADWLAFSALAYDGLGEDGESKRRVAEALAIDPDFSIRKFNRWNGEIYQDRSIPENRHYAVFRKLGIPD